MTLETFYKEHALVRGKILDWTEFANENPWVLDSSRHYAQKPVASNCLDVYYVVDLDKKAVTDRLCFVTWDPQYKQEFKNLNIAWVEKFFKVEESDIKQLETPEIAILQPGGEIFFLIEGSGRVAGVVSTVIEDGNCELAKMTVRDECTGRGYANILMAGAINWAKEHKYPFIELLSSIQLENAIALYKKHGFVTTHLGPHPHYERCSIIMRLTF